MPVTKIAIREFGAKASRPSDLRSTRVGDSNGTAKMRLESLARTRTGVGEFGSGSSWPAKGVDIAQNTNRALKSRNKYRDLGVTIPFLLTITSAPNEPPVCFENV